MHPGDQFTFPQNQIRHAQKQRNRERENAREQPYGRPSRAEGLSAECVEGVEHDGNVQTDNSSGECRLSQLDKTVFIRASQSGPAAQNRPITSADKWTEIRFLTARFWADARPRRISVLPYIHLPLQRNHPSILAHRRGQSTRCAYFFCSRSFAFLIEMMRYAVPRGTHTTMTIRLSSLPTVINRCSV